MQKKEPRKISFKPGPVINNQRMMPSKMLRILPPITHPELKLELAMHFVDLMESVDDDLINTIENHFDFNKPIDIVVIISQED